jgi:putative redox protein
MTEDTHRAVRIERVAGLTYTVTNERGGTMTIGSGGGSEFTAVELLLAAIGGCTAVDVDILTSRRAEPESFTVETGAEKVRDEKGRNLLTDITVTFRIVFPDGEGGDKARALLPDAVRRSHESLCTVSRTVELGTPVTTHIELVAPPRSRVAAKWQVSYSSSCSAIFGQQRTASLTRSASSGGTSAARMVSWSESSTKKTSGTRSAQTALASHSMVSTVTLMPRIVARHSPRWRGQIVY